MRPALPQPLKTIDSMVRSVMTFPPHPLHVAAGVSDNKGAPAPSPLQLPTPLQLPSPLPIQGPSSGPSNSPGPSQPAPTLSTPSGAAGGGEANTTTTNNAGPLDAGSTEGGSLEGGAGGEGGAGQAGGPGGSGETGVGEGLNTTQQSINTPPNNSGAAASSTPSPVPARSCAPSSLNYSCSLVLDSRATVHWTLGGATPVNVCTSCNTAATNASALQGEVPLLALLTVHPGQAPP